MDGFTTRFFNSFPHFTFLYDGLKHSDTMAMLDRFRVLVEEVIEVTKAGKSSFQTLTLAYNFDISTTWTLVLSNDRDQ